jgi:hypothetical protein
VRQAKALTEAHWHRASLADYQSRSPGPGPPGLVRYPGLGVADHWQPESLSGPPGPSLLDWQLDSKPPDID